MLIISGESGHPCLIPDFRGTAFNFLPLRVMPAVGLSYIAFQLKKKKKQYISKSAKKKKKKELQVYISSLNTYMKKNKLCMMAWPSY